jgi:hypothetical protein
MLVGYARVSTQDQIYILCPYNMARGSVHPTR